MICDHAINFHTDTHPETVWPQCADEGGAAQAYDVYLRAVFDRPYIVGYHRCQYIDRTVSGRSLLKQGLLRSDESPYTILIEQVRRTNKEILAAFRAM